MKKVIKISESQLMKLISKVIDEQQEPIQALGTKSVDQVSKYPNVSFWDAVKTKNQKVLWKHLALVRNIDLTKPLGPGNTGYNVRTGGYNFRLPGGVYPQPESADAIIRSFGEILGNATDHFATPQIQAIFNLNYRGDQAIKWVPKIKVIVPPPMTEITRGVTIGRNIKITPSNKDIETPYQIDMTNNVIYISAQQTWQGTRDYSKLKNTVTLAIKEYQKLRQEKMHQSWKNSSHKPPIQAKK